MPRADILNMRLNRLKAGEKIHYHLTMKHTLLLIVAALCLFMASCRSKNVPDVSKIQVSLEVSRFEKDFFAIDTNQLPAALQNLSVRYPVFLKDFTNHIMGLPPVSDTSQQVFAALRQFIRDYKPLKDSADQVFGDLEKVRKDIEQGFRYTRFYFPSYTLPQKLVTFIGPMDAFFEASLGGYGDVMTTGGLAVGLQLHLGSNFSFYHSPMGESLYPAYISRRFTPDMIVVNCMKNIIDDLYPENVKGKGMVEQMVEKGKRMYLLDRLLPYTADTLKIGYTDKQLKGCYENEGSIWNFFLTNNFLYSKEPDILKNYLGDGPNTQELGPGSPGYIGIFCGWQIVKKYMSQHEELPLSQLLQTDAKKIFEESKYRPK